MSPQKQTESRASLKPDHKDQLFIFSPQFHLLVFHISCLLFLVYYVLFIIYYLLFIVALNQSRRLEDSHYFITLLKAEDFSDDFN